MRIKHLLFVILASCSMRNGTTLCSSLEPAQASRCLPEIQIRLLKKVYDPEIHYGGEPNFLWREFERGIVFSPDESKFVMTQKGGDFVQVYKIPSARSLFSLRPYDRGTYGIGFSTDSKDLITEGLDNLPGVKNITTRKTWDAKKGTLLSSHEVSSDELPSGQSFEKNSVPESYVDSLEFPRYSYGIDSYSIRGNTLLLEGSTTIGGRYNASGSTDEHILCWDIVQKKLLTMHTDWSKAELHPSGKQVVAIDYSTDKVSVWDLEQNKELFVLPSYYNDVSYFENGKSLVTTDLNNFVQVWDSQTGKIRLNLTPGYAKENQHESIVIVNDVNPQKEWNHSAWDIKTGQKISDLGDVRKYLFSPSGNFFVTIDPDGFSLWEVRHR